MPQVANPHKKFQFSMSLFGLNPFLAQKVTSPDVELDVVEHGDTNHIIKTAGIAKFGNIMVEKISSASIDPLNNWVWDWTKRIQNTFTGGGEVPQDYKVDCNIFKYATDGQLIIGQWRMVGAWPCKINGVDLNRVESDNTIESIEFCIDKLDHI